jgi:hypothetical protein
MVYQSNQKLLKTHGIADLLSLMIITSYRLTAELSACDASSDAKRDSYQIISKQRLI